MKKRIFWAIWASVLVTIRAVAADYSLTDLGTLSPGQAMVPWSINDSSQIVGTGYSGSFAQFSAFHVIDASQATAFLWDDGSLTALPSMAGRKMIATSINEFGVISGYTQNEGYYPGVPPIFVQDDTRGAVWNGGTVSSLGPGFYQSVINGSGQIVGGGQVWLNGSASELSSLIPAGSGWSYATAKYIDDAGQIVGSGQLNGETRAFLLSGGTMTDLGSFGGPYTFASAINNSGQVVGISAVQQVRGDSIISYLSHPFLWDAGTINSMNGVNFTTDSFEVYNMNEAGNFVGYAVIGEIVGTRAIQYYDHAFVWLNGNTTDLNSLSIDASGWRLNRATDINNLGQIVGYGTINGETHAFLLTPVPEANSLVLLGVGLGLVAFRYRDRLRGPGSRRARAR